MKREWTGPQQAAIDHREGNLLVSAGAGSGKTAVLVERIIRQVIDEQNPVDINRLLVVTFTNAAAAEMRQRIGSALFQQLKEAKNPKIAEYLQKQLSLLNIASITTLHSFCLDLLREHNLSVNLPAKFAIVNETEKTLLMEEVLDGLLEEFYAAKDPAFLSLIDAYGGREDELVRKIILELYGFSLSQPKPIAWLKGLSAQYEIADEEELQSSLWYAFLRQQCVAELDEAIAFLEGAVVIAGKAQGPESYLPQLAEEKAMLEDVRRQMSEPFCDGCKIFSSLSFGTLRLKGKCDLGLKEQAKGYRDKAKAIALRWRDHIFLRSNEENLRQIQSLYPVVETFITLTETFYERIQEAKAKKAWVDFSDLEHFALVLLEDDTNGIARSLQEKFSEVLVDEYQDINRAQEAILQLVSRGDNRFFVGDVKQSIYRFRLAEPGLFQEKYQAYEQGETGRKIDLSVNFRSQGEILKGINFVFAQLMNGGVTEIDYNEDAYLVPRRTDCTPYPIELDIIDVKQAKEEEEDDTSAAQREARVIGRKIQQLAEEGYAYGDMVILLRSTKNWAGVFQEEFQLLGIPCYAEVNNSYFEAPELSLMTSILQVIDNPYQDIPLAGVLLSVFGGFTPDDLTTVRMGECGLLYDALLRAEEKEIASCLKEKIHGFLEKLDTLRYAALNRPVAALIDLIYQEYHLYQWVGLLPGGTVRQANLNAFYRQAKEYDEGAYRGLYRFVLLLERMAQTGTGISSAASVGSGEAAVRIMSIHHSKGLEFPIVFVAGLGRKFNLQDTIGDVLLHRELGIGIVAMDKKNHVKYQTLPKIAIMEKARQETLGEELRVLYVALTRAKDRLILIGSCNNLEKSVQGWIESCDCPLVSLPFDAIRNSKSSLDWLARAVIRHKDGMSLRRQTDFSVGEICPEVYHHDSTWQVAILQSAGEGVLAPAENTAFLDSLKELEPMADAPLQEEINEILSWQYPWQSLADKEGKLSVTQLQRRRQQEPLEDFSFLYEREDDAAVTASVTSLRQETDTRTDPRFRGTMHHFIFEHLTLTPNLDAADIRRQIDEMLEQGALPQEMASQINDEGICRFFSQSVGQELLQAEQVYRELPFLFAVPTEEIYGDDSDGEWTVLQGTIDLAFSTAEGWVIVDYKSGGGDYGAKKADIVGKYGGQVNQYARAFTSITGELVKRKYIYLLQQGKFVEIP